MKKFTLLLCTTYILMSCLSTTKTPMTAFIVKNTSDKPISFTASVIKMSVTFGTQEITRSFTVKPHDSMIARQTYFKRDGDNPQRWFTKFEIFPVDGIMMSKPEKSENWIKGEKDKVPTYTFTLNK
ncbi:hypothetical protein ODZ84_00715 [Chryseobacterium fluminis]|uniref:hypothetical protein n=1 Tax=Chryseobacterium fluminis TaxID=2983606 RepID=UPI00224D1FE8|nr:hypothetical protein [Chryseobacterium sp. MMS21-Ot14]UZT98125.1 hypothetical protein ODZ84_00715 [Chryseobacterium sp. MMS21-Ot14]